MSSPSVFSNHFGFKFRICLPGEYPRAGKTVFKPLSFADPTTAEYFVRSLNIPSYLLINFAQTSQFARLELERSVARQLVSGRLRCFRIPEGAADRKSVLSSFTDRDGTSFGIQNGSTLLEQTPELIKSFTGLDIEVGDRDL